MITSNLPPHVFLLSLLPPPDVQQDQDGSRRCHRVLRLLMLHGGGVVEREGAASRVPGAVGPAGSPAPLAGAAQR